MPSNLQGLVTHLDGYASASIHGFEAITLKLANDNCCSAVAKYIDVSATKACSLSNKRSWHVLCV